MVYLHFPSKFTEEETMLQAKYQKLKRKKKALVKQKTPRQEPERSPKKIVKGPKVEARDAREVAKKLLKSGAISPIVKTPKRPENEGFKRPARFRGLDRKPTEEKAVPSYQPFSASPVDEINDIGNKPPPPPSSSLPPKIKAFKLWLNELNSRIRFTEMTLFELCVHGRASDGIYFDILCEQNLYDNFVVSGQTQSKIESEKPEFDKGSKSKQGNTIFVSGFKVSEEFLKRTFSTYGSIVDVSMETGKERGFVTFKKSESAEAAIREMDGQKTGGSLLKVSMAKKQLINPANEVVANEDWCYIAGNFGQKGSNYSDKREPVGYDDL